MNFFLQLKERAVKNRLFKNIFFSVSVFVCSVLLTTFSLIYLLYYEVCLGSLNAPVIVFNDSQGFVSEVNCVYVIHESYQTI